MRWHDLADIVKRAAPEQSPESGMCFRSEDTHWTVARVDTRDATLGWAVWFGRRRMAASLHLATAQQGMAIAEVLMLPIHGVAWLLRARARLQRIALAGVLVLSAVRQRLGMRPEVRR